MKFQNTPPVETGDSHATIREPASESGKATGPSCFHLAESSKEVLGQNADSYVTVNKNGTEIVISAPQPITLNRMVL